MQIILFDNPLIRENLKPITLTRPIADIRIGIFRISEKWEKYSKLKCSHLSEKYLNDLFPTFYGDENLYINASVLPNIKLVKEILSLKVNEALVYENELIALKSTEKLKFGFDFENNKIIETKSEINILKNLPDLFLKNPLSILNDFNDIIEKGNSTPITDNHVISYNKKNIFIGKNVNIKACILNAELGPIYIADNAVIQEGSLIIGPASIGEHSMVAFGAKIRPNTSLGPYCRVGGEVGNSIFHAYSNKAHDGFLGNSYIGSWCNLGANTNNSNLKNDYKEVKLYNFKQKELVSTNEIFCGTFMGDYSKTGISTMLNTGTVIGVCANVFGAGFQEKYIPSFSWGGKAEGVESYRFDKAVEVINATMARKDLALTNAEIELLKKIDKEK